LYPPFLPGAERDSGEPVAVARAREVEESQVSFTAPIRPIEDFLAAAPKPTPTPSYRQERSESSHTFEPADEPDELPPVEHFLDPLPVVDQFAPDAEGALSDAWPEGSEAGANAGAKATDTAETGWSDTDWQRYDWRAAAALGEGPDAEASNAWASTDWDGTLPKTRDEKSSAAQAIASALDRMAQRRREGELALPGSAAIPDPAKIADTLAALLGVKR
jgi:hypothetical protein